MNTKLVFVLCAALFACTFAENCVFTVQSEADGKFYKYDLSKMSHAVGEKDDLYYRMDDGSFIYMNLCNPSSEKCSGGTAVCLRSSDATKHTSLGKATSQDVDDAVDLDPGQGVQITYSDGDDCILGSWQSVVTVKCDPNADGVGEIVEADSGECWYRIAINSKYGCGKDVSDGSDGSGDPGETAALVILLVLLFCVIGYFAIGVVYQMKVKDAATPREYIIHNEFWCALPSLIKDGFLFIIHCGKGDYESV